MDLAQALRDEIERRAMTQREVAERLGTTQQTLSRWVNGEMRPRGEHLPAIARFLGLPVTEVRRLRAAMRPHTVVEERITALEERLGRIEDQLTLLVERRRRS